MPLTVLAVAEATGISQHSLRVWEERYGWPKPKRDRHGVRIYTPELVEALKDVKARVDAGEPIGAILYAGAVIPRKPGHQLVPKVARIHIEIEDLPRPQTPPGTHAQRKLVEAVNKGDLAEIEFWRHACYQLHPGDRKAAVFAVLKAAGIK